MKADQFFDPKLLNKYNTSGPRYTSYPTALECHSEFSNDDFIKADKYLTVLAEEIASRAEHFTDYTVKQLHWGGGTPSFLTHKQISDLVTLLKTKLNFSDELEMSIEIDPREIELDLADHLFSLGFNRLSLSVQDLDEKVQKTINRVQSTQFLEDFIKHSKAVGFNSVNIELIYGLPHQTLESFKYTLDKANEWDVDRMSLFSYAHLPSRFAAQRKLRDEWLPSVSEKFALMKLAIETLCDYGYDFIGMDHFAKKQMS